MAIVRLGSFPMGIIMKLLTMSDWTITTSTAHGYSSGCYVELSGLEPTGIRGMIYRFLFWSKIFKIEARMFRSITEQTRRFTIGNVTATTMELQ